MKILIDMNLTPDWVAVLARHGWESVHWSAVGAASASDQVILDWSARHGYVLFTHDLDFGSILAATKACAPSVIQVRTQDVLPAHLEAVLIPVLRRFESHLEEGVLLVVDEARARVRILPLTET